MKQNYTPPLVVFMERIANQSPFAFIPNTEEPKCLTHSSLKVNARQVKSVDNHKFNLAVSTAKLLNEYYNTKKLIPKGDEAIYANSWIDPNDEDFNTKLSRLWIFIIKDK